MASSLQNRVLGLPIGETIYGKTCLIVGYGNIAKELAPRLLGILGQHQSYAYSI